MLHAVQRDDRRWRRFVQPVDQAGRFLCFRHGADRPRDPPLKIRLGEFGRSIKACRGGLSRQWRSCRDRCRLLALPQLPSMAPINNPLGGTPMDTPGNSLAAPSRRRVIKGALAAGIAAPAILRITPALRRLSGAAGADHRRQHAGRPVRHHRPHHGGGDAAGDRRHVLRREPRRRRRQYRHGARRALRSRRLHHPADDQRLFGQSRALQHAALRSVQGFFRDLRARDLAACVRGQARPRSEDDEGVRRARESQSGEVQRLDAADRHHAAAAGRGAQAARRLAGHGDGGVRRRRRRAPGADRRHRAAFLRRARARASAHQGRQDPGPCRHRHQRAGTTCRRSRPWSRPATRTSCSTPTPR